MESLVLPNASSSGEASPSSGLLAVTPWNPTGTVIRTAQSTSLVDVDAGNLSISFVVPASGNVLVRLSAVCDVSAASGSYNWGLRQGSSVVAGSSGLVLWEQDSEPKAGRANLPIYLSGLTPGASITYKWAHSTPVAGGARLVVGDNDASPDWGAALMEVWTA